MTWFTTLNASEISHLGLCVVACPHFQAPPFFVPIHRTFIALHNVALSAVVSHMAPLVALKAEFLIAVKGIVSVLPAQNAIQSFPFIRAFLSPVSI